MEDLIIKTLVGLLTLALAALAARAGKMWDKSNLHESQIKRLDEDFREFKKNVNADLDDLEKECHDLKDRFVKDQIERKDLIAFAASIETKIEAKMRPFMAELAEQRRQDTAIMTKAVNDLEKTMAKQNTVLDFLMKDVTEMKAQRNNINAERN